MTYRQVLATRSVTRLLLGTLVGRLPGGMCPLAIALALRDAGASYRAVGLVAGSYLCAMAVVGPLLGRLVDRRSHTVVLRGTAAGAAAGLVALALLDPLPALLAAAVLAGGLTPPLEPALRSRWPELVVPRLLRSAYGLDTAAQSLIFVLGPLLVSLVAVLHSADGSLMLAAALTVSGTALVTWSSRPAPGRAADRGPALLRLRVYVLLLLGLAGAGASVGALGVFAVGYAEQCALPGGAGALPSIAAAAGLVGGLAVGSLRRWMPPAWLLGLGLAGGTALLAAVPACSPVVFPAAAASGFLLPPLLAAGFAVLGAEVPPHRRAEALAWLVTLFTAGNAVSTALAGRALDAGGPPGAALVGAGLAALGALVLLGVRQPGRPTGRLARRRRAPSFVPRAVERARHERTRAFSGAGRWSRVRAAWSAGPPVRPAPCRRSVPAG